MTGSAIPEKARAALDAALALSPKHPAALARLARIELRARALGPAEAAIQRLLASATEDADRAGALVLGAQLARDKGDAAATERLLCEAVAIEGPAGEAAAAFRKVTAGGQSWVAFAAALAAHLQRPGRGGDPAAAYLVLADTYATRMGLPRKALEVLEDGLQDALQNGRP